MAVLHGTPIGKAPIQASSYCERTYRLVIKDRWWQYKRWRKVHIHVCIYGYKKMLKLLPPSQRSSFAKPEKSTFCNFRDISTCVWPIMICIGVRRAFKQKLINT